MAASVDVISASTCPPPVGEGEGGTHVLFLIDQLCARGGAEVALLNTVRWLPTRFRTTVMTLRSDPGCALLEEFPSPVLTWPLRKTYDWSAIRTARKLLRFIKDERVDIVHTFFPSSDLWGGAVARLSRGPALISGRRDMGILRKPAHRIAYRAFRDMFDCVLANSEEVRQYSIEQDGLDPERVETIYNGLDFGASHAGSKMADSGPDFDLESASHVVTTVANLRRIKGLDTFIRAAAIVCRKFPSAAFVIAGALDPAEPELRAELESLSQSLGVAGNVRFVGGVSEVSSLLIQSDVFCLLSNSEGFSNALIEAMGYGLPCVATRVGGNAEAITDHESGFLVEKQDPAAAASRILQLLDNKDLSRTVGKRARLRATTHFSSTRYIARLVSVYERVLANRKLTPLPQ
jgi:L-malate glycosyltransferase